MCIIFNHDIYKASDTLIVVTPVSTPPGRPQQWQLVYINSIVPNVFSPVDKPAPLMVMAIPNPHDLKEEQFPLYAVSSANANALQTSVSELIKPYAPLPTSSNQSPISFGASNSFGDKAYQPPRLKVQSVGGYNICVAPTLSDLKTRAPWNKFSISDQNVRNTLSDMERRYENQKMAFLIAEGNMDQTSPFTNRTSSTPSIRCAGFGVGYSDSCQHGSFFPTSHEPKTDQSNQVFMDVTCVAINAIIRPLSLIPISRHVGVKPHNFLENSDSNVVLRVDDSFGFVPSKWPHTRTLFNALPKISTHIINGTRLAQLETPRLMTMWRLHGQFPNSDIRARTINDMDVLTSNQTFYDVDWWLLKKSQETQPIDSFRIVNSSRFDRLDIVFALLARQLADPGIVDRHSDAAQSTLARSSKNCEYITRHCGPVSYFNLDHDNIDLDEDAYLARNSWARVVNNETVDTTGSTYVRISAQCAPFESIADRTVQPLPVQGQVTQGSNGENANNKQNGQAMLFLGA